MDKKHEKFSKFSHMIMKEADEKKKEIIMQAEKLHKETIASREIEYLKRAYESIQTAVRKIEKELNEEVSQAILESKQALFTRREEIINTVFENVKQKLCSFRSGPGYNSYIEDRVNLGLSQVGQGDIEILADSEDIELIKEILNRLRINCKIIESEEVLLGGFLIINRTKGFMCDFSFVRSLKEEKSGFLEKYEISIE